MRSLLVLLVCWLGASWARGGDFEAANQLYDQGKFAEARAGYDRLVSSGAWSANLFYNLGDAAYRVGAAGEAMLAYERALTLDPGHPEARANLHFLRGETGAIPWPRSWLDRLFLPEWFDAYAIVLVLAGWSAVFLLTAILFRPRKDRSGLWIGLVAALLIAGYATGGIWHVQPERARGIVISKSAQVHLAPAESAVPADTLAAGSEVRVLSVRGEWVYCALPAGGRGWIAGKAVARVRLGAS